MRVAAGEQIDSFCFGINELNSINGYFNNKSKLNKDDSS